VGSLSSAQFPPPLTPDSLPGNSYSERRPRPKSEDENGEYSRMEFRSRTLSMNPNPKSEDEEYPQSSSRSIAFSTVSTGTLDSGEIIDSQGVRKSWDERYEGFVMDILRDNECTSIQS